VAEPVDWRADGQPYSPRFGDIYHSEAGATDQARHVFLRGCGLPDAWSNAPQWRILETGFGFGLNFLTTWQAWRADPQRPRMLHFVSAEGYPVAREDLRRAAQPYPELADLAERLAAQWHGLLPGFHRLVFDEGRVLLTLCVGEVWPMLRAQQGFEADSLYLDGFSPDRNPQMWAPETLKALARFARPGTRLATWSVARALRDALVPLGFRLEKAPGLPPKRDCLRGVFDPAWTLRRPPPPEGERTAGPGTCAVVGAGLAGAAVAASLARRGWQVTVLDAAPRPAAGGASAAPAGVLAPHVSPDDALLSRLTRAGVRATWQQLEDLLAEGRDWGAGGVLERRDGAIRLPPGWHADGPNESLPANAAHLRAAGLPGDTAALWHARAGWVRPARLVEAWLARPGIRFEGGCRIAGLARDGACWQVLDDQGAARAQAQRVVLAAGHGTRALAPDWPLQPVRGQLLWGRVREPASLPAVPLNGDGHFIGRVSDDEGTFWLSGATFEPGSDDTAIRAADVQANRDRLARLHPGAAQALAGDFARGAVQAWAGVRCASGDRRPLVGPAGDALPGVWLCTALGSRGLSFAALLAELLAARWHGEPLALPAAMARALDTRRATRTGSP